MSLLIFNHLNHLEGWYVDRISHTLWEIGHQLHPSQTITKVTHYRSLLLCNFSLKSCKKFLYRRKLHLANPTGWLKGQEIDCSYV